MEPEPDPIVPDLRPSWVRWLQRIDLRRQARWLLVSVALTSAIRYWSSGADEAGAKAVLEDTLEAPASARYLSFETLAKQGEWRLVHVVLDVQNPFGARLRKSLCVTYRVEEGQYRWSRADGVLECGKPPSARELALLERLNGWPGSAARAGAGP